MLRRTKIVATLGPATDRDNNLEKIIRAGANVVRMNFSHGSAEDHIQRAKQVRKIATRLGVEVAILGDLQGPKIRVSSFKDTKVLLNLGQRFILDTAWPKDAGTDECVGCDYEDLPKDVKPGDILLLDDGRIQLKVKRVQDTQVFTEVTVAGYLSNKKGINKQGGGLSAAALTDKDKEDIITAAKMDVDFLAVSFPRCGDDMRYARTLADQAGLKAKLVAKVERAEAVATDAALAELIEASDAVMVARGDLGVEIGDAQLMAVQKKMIRMARDLNRSVITATQMMESMINAPLPTRAEVMDVANAVVDGTDAVMLSAETAAGNFPEQTVMAMSNVCIGAEQHPSTNVSRHRMGVQFKTAEEATAMSTMYAANHLEGVKAIIALTHSGTTPLLLSRISSGIPIFAMAQSPKTLAWCNLYRGVTPLYFEADAGRDMYETCQLAIERIRDTGIVQRGDLVLLTHGDVVERVGGTNTCKILTVE